MTKQEQIEEMGKVMPEKIKDPLDNSRYIIFGKSLRREIARIYYNAGYRKLPDGAVVLLIGENNQALDEKTIEYFVKHNEQIREETVKEFAEKLKNKLFEFFQDNEERDGKISVGTLYVDVIGVEAKDGTIISLGLIDRLLKEYEEWHDMKVII